MDRQEIGGWKCWVGGGGGLADPENVECLSRGIGLVQDVAHDKVWVQGGLGDHASRGRVA